MGLNRLHSVHVHLFMLLGPSHHLAGFWLLSFSMCLSIWGVCYSELCKQECTKPPCELKESVIIGTSSVSPSLSHYGLFLYLIVVLIFFSCARLDPDNPDHSKSVKDESYNDGDDERGEDDYGASDDESDTNSGTEKDAEPKKPKRTRTAYSNSQLDQLELIFATTHYPDVFTREDLSRRLGIREDRIQVKWHDILSRRI